MKFIMNHYTVYRKALVGSVVLLIFFIDLVAVYQIFPNFWQVFLFSVILGVTTLLIIGHHQRSLECENCMEENGPNIYLFYKVFLAIGCFSVLLIFLGHLIFQVNVYFQIIVATIYAFLLTVGVYAAFKAMVNTGNASTYREIINKNKMKSRHGKELLDLSMFEFISSKIKKNNSYIYMSCLFFSFLSLIVYPNTGLIFDLVTIMIFISFLFFLKSYIFEIRLRKKWYVNNYFEARDAIKLIDENFENFNKKNGPGNMRVFPCYTEKSKDIVSLGEKV